jgi:hypothetical protein
LQSTISILYLDMLSTCCGLLCNAALQQALSGCHNPHLDRAAMASTVTVEAHSECPVRLDQPADLPPARVGRAWEEATMQLEGGRIDAVRANGIEEGL